ncbi:amino acid adenylation domain-containing protein [uncultured Aquimarina sp.]|uniref:non-ribosomal peptide synthetase n=1 Tax=uncultured Aquimarina sp. TaxID=575652 RepID=UPI0026304EC2|nr:amino acid adenylation domain-containing protein [uncultured Aquimarina sp.]
MEIVSFINKLRQNGVGVKLSGDDLELILLKEDIEADTIELVKKNKEKIKEYLISISSKKFTQIPKAPISESYPMSNAQNRLWVQSQIEEASISYNMPFKVELDGSYHIDHLKKAINFAIDRHEVLRTVFQEGDKEETRQCVKSKEELGFYVDYIDFRDKESPEIASKKYLDIDSLKPFDLTGGPLIRAAILQLQDDKYIFYYNMHHIISDGWSVQVLAKDVLTCYEAYVNNEEPLLEELRIQYKDYAVWHLEQSKKESFLKHKNYWLEELKGELPILEFPSSKKRPPIKTYNGKTLTTYISKETSSDLKAYVNEKGGSLFMGVLSSLKILLSRYARQEDIIVGSPIAAREHVDLTNQIGFYVNTLALRNKIIEEDTFNDIFLKVKKSTLAAYVNQQYPFENLVEDLNLKRDLSRNPIFDIMVVLQNNAMGENPVDVNKDNLNEFYEEGNKTSKFDLLFNIEEKGDYLAFSIEYNTDIYEENIIKQFSKHYKQILCQLLKQPAKAVKNIDYLSIEDRNDVINEFNATSKNHNKTTVIELFENQVQKTPDKIALVFEEDTITYDQLNRYSNQLAHCLREEYEVSADTKVGVILERSNKNVLAMLAILKSGACYVPVDNNYQDDRINYILNDASIDLILSTGDLLDNNSIGARKSIDLNTFNFSEWKKSNPKIVNTLDDSSFIIYTSGSTGNPKGVVQTHRMLSNLIQWNIKDSGIDSGLNHLQYTSFSFDVSLQDCCFVLSSGGTLFIAKEELKLNFLELSNYILDKGIEVLCFPFSALTNFFNKRKEDFLRNHQIKHIISSGEQLTINQSLLDFLNTYPKVKLHNHYGPSETHVVTSYTMCKEEGEINCYAPIGKPISNTNIYILDGNLIPVPVEVKGEIYIGGDNLAHGYLNLPNETKERFINDPFNENKLLYKTGDVGYWKDDGNIIYLRRNDDQVKIRGYRVELGEIKNTLLSLETIAESFVDIQEINGDAIIVAYVVLNSLIDKKALRTILSKELPDYMIPTHYLILDAIPLTSNGKINKKLLPKASNDDIVDREYVAPKTEIEEQLVTIWENVLEIDRIGITDNFFELGGHSIKAIKVLSLIHEEFNAKINMKKIFSNPTIEFLSLEIENFMWLEENKNKSEKKKILI